MGRTCNGCRLGETPSDIIQSRIKSELDQESPTVDPEHDVSQAMQKLANKVADNLGLKVTDVLLAAKAVRLHRRGGGGAAAGETAEAEEESAPPPASGYFEFINKHDQICCIKVLHSGCDQKFEIPRPSYFAGNNMISIS